VYSETVKIVNAGEIRVVITKGAKEGNVRGGEG
jgi:hypothetical protein